MTGSARVHRHNVTSARELRTCPTSAEAVLWEALRNRGLDGLKFRRQYPIGPFVVDFCCPERHLVIEVDGDVHETQREHDAAREALLVTAGYSVIHVRNEAVLGELAAVLARILTAASEVAPIPASERRSTEDG